MEALCAKLNSPLDEVRHRALHTLHSKLQCGLLRPEVLLALPSLPRNLLSLLTSPEEPRAQLREALALLEALALHPSIAKSLLALDAPRALEQLNADPDRGAHVCEEVAAVARALARQRLGEERTLAHEPTDSRNTVVRGAVQPESRSSFTSDSRDEWTPPQAWSSVNGSEGLSALPSQRTRSPPADAVGTVHSASRSLDFAQTPAARTSVVPLPPVDPSTLPPMHWMSIAPIPLGARDVQAVLDASVQLSMHDIRVLRMACSSLGGSLCHDVPVSGLLQRPALMRNLLSLLRSSELSEMGSISSLVLDTASELIGRVTTTLRHNFDPLGGSESRVGSRFAARSAQGDGDDRSPSHVGDCSDHNGNGCAEDSAEAAWPVWQLAGEIWMSVVPLLRHEQSISRSVPLLLRTLPLLYLPPEGASDIVVHQAATLWRGYFDKICDVIRYHRLLGSGASVCMMATTGRGAGGGGCLGDDEFHETNFAPFFRAPSARGVLTTPVALLAIAAASTPSAVLLRASASPELLCFLRLVSCDPWIAVCRPHAHRAVCRCLRQIAPDGAHLADGASKIEHAAQCAGALRQTAVSTASIPGEGHDGLCPEQEGESTRPRPSFPGTIACNGLAHGHMAAATPAIHRRISLLRRSLPALAYFELPELLREIVNVCIVPDARGDALPLLLPCLTHPLGTVREATLRHLLSLLLTSGEALAQASAGRRASQSSMPRASDSGRGPGTGAAAAAEVRVEDLDGSAGSSPIDQDGDGCGAEGGLDDHVEGDKEARWAEAEEQSACLLALLSRRACLLVLIEIALGMGVFTESSADLSIISQMRLAEAVVLAISSQLSDSPMGADGWCASVAASLPIVQSRLPSPLNFAAVSAAASSSHTAPSTRLHAPSTAGAHTATTYSGGPSRGGHISSVFVQDVVGTTKGSITTPGSEPACFWRESQVRTEMDADVAATASVHAHILHCTLVPALDSNARLCAALRMLLHKDETLAAQAAAQLAASLSPPPPSGSVPAAPLHNLPSPPAELLHPIIQGRHETAGTERPPLRVTRASAVALPAGSLTTPFTVSELRDLETLVQNQGLEPSLRASAAAQLAVLVSAPHVLALAFHPQIVEGVLQTAAAVLASLTNSALATATVGTGSSASGCIGTSHPADQAGAPSSPDGHGTTEGSAQQGLIDLLAALFHLLAAIANGCASARVALLHSSHALHVFRRAVFLSSPAPRAALRFLLASILFSTEDLASAASTFALPDLSLPPDAMAAAAHSNDGKGCTGGNSTALPVTVSVAFDLPVDPIRHHSNGTAHLVQGADFERMSPPDAMMGRMLACRRLLREAIKTEGSARRQTYAGTAAEVVFDESKGSVHDRSNLPSHCSKDEGGLAKMSWCPCLREEVFSVLAADEDVGPEDANTLSEDTSIGLAGGSHVAQPDSRAHLRRAAVERAFCLDPDFGIRRALERLEAASDHDDCARILSHIAALSISHEILVSISSFASPPPHPLLGAIGDGASDGLLSRLLITPPATAEDDALLESLLRLISRALGEPNQDTSCPQPPESELRASPCSFRFELAPEVHASPTSWVRLPRVLFDCLLGSGLAVLERSRDDPNASSLPRGQLRLVVLRYGTALLSHPGALGAATIPDVRASLLRGRLLTLLANEYCGCSSKVNEISRHEGVDVDYPAAKLPDVPPSVRRAALALLCTAFTALSSMLPKPQSLTLSKALSGACDTLAPNGSTSPKRRGEAHVDGVIAGPILVSSSFAPEGGARMSDTTERSNINPGLILSLMHQLLPCARRCRPCASSAGVSEQRLALVAIGKLVQLLPPEIPAGELQPVLLEAGRASPRCDHKDTPRQHWLLGLIQDPDALVKEAALKICSALGAMPHGVMELLPALDDIFAAAVAVAADASCSFVARVAALNLLRIPLCEPFDPLGVSELEMADDDETHAAKSAPVPGGTGQDANGLRAEVFYYGIPGNQGMLKGVGDTALSTWREVERHGVISLACRLLSSHGAPPQVIRGSASLLLSILRRWPRRASLRLEHPTIWMDAVRWLSVANFWQEFLVAQRTSFDDGKLCTATADAFDVRNADPCSITEVPVTKAQAAYWLTHCLPQAEATRTAILRLLWTYAVCDGGARLDSLLRTTHIVATAAQLLAPPLWGAIPVFCEAENIMRPLTPPPLSSSTMSQLGALAALHSELVSADAWALAWAASAETRHVAVQFWHAILDHVPELGSSLLRCTLQVPSCGSTSMENGVSMENAKTRRRGDKSATPTQSEPWILCLLGCLSRRSPMRLRLGACSLLSRLLSRASSSDAAVLDVEISARCPSLELAVKGKVPSTYTNSTAEVQQLSANTHSFGFRPCSTPGAELATALVALDREATQIYLASVSEALRVLLGCSHSAQVRLLQDGFLPILASRITDLLGLCPLSSRRHARSAAAASRSRPQMVSAHGAGEASFKADDVTPRLPDDIPQHGGCGADDSAIRAPEKHAQSLGVTAGSVGTQAELVDRLVSCMGVLTNLIAGCEEAKLACVSLQLPLLLQQLWSLGRALPTIRKATLPLLCNYVAHCAPAKCSLTAYADSRGRCLVALVVRAVTAAPRSTTSAPMDIEQWKLHWQVLQALATSTESRTTLLRCGAIAALPPLIRRLLAKGERVDEVRAAPVIDFIANLTFDAEGCASLLKMDDAFECLLDALTARHSAPTRHASALALRNVAFTAEGKGAMLAKQRALPAMLALLDGRDLRLAAYISSALWALLSRCERAKVAFRRGGHLARQLQKAESELAILAFRPPPFVQQAPNRALLEMTLRNLDVVATLLGLDPTRLRA